MALLTIRLNLFGGLRELTQTGEPDLVQVGVLCELAGVDGLAIQMRRDRRQVRDRDLGLLRQTVRNRLAVELPPIEDIVTRVLETKPSIAIFTADQPDPSSPPDAIDFSNVPVDFGDLSAGAHGLGVQSCFFIEPNPESIKGASRAAADSVLISCKAYCEARDLSDAQRELDRIDAAAQLARKAGLGVMAGRGISYQNVPPLRELGNIEEFVIGRSFVARSSLVGIERAVKEMKELVR